MTPTFDALQAEADALYQQGRYQEARALYQRSVDIDPRHQNAFYAVVRIEFCDDQIMARAWYGERPPDPYPVGILSAISIAASSSPYLHHVLGGKAAYEAFHIAHYLTDLLRVRRHPNVIHTSFLALYFAMKASRQTRVEFSEIGGSLYAAYEKMAACRNFSFQQGLPGPEPQVDHICVELSDRLRLLAKALHGADPISFYAHWRDAPKPATLRFSFSLGVANYAFARGLECTEWIKQNEAVLIRERFTVGGDFTHHIMGKQFVCFDLFAMLAELASSGYRAILLSLGEAPRFLDSSDQLQRSDTVFFNAHVLIHKLTDFQLDQVADWWRSVGGERIPPFHDTDPPLVIRPHDFRNPRSIDETIQSFDWKRDYVHEAGTKTRPHSPRFDFSQTALRDHLANYLAIIDRSYSSALKDTLCAPEVSGVPLIEPPPQAEAAAAAIPKRADPPLDARQMLRNVAGADLIGELAFRIRRRARSWIG
jgi:hypothetical protein